MNLSAFGEVIPPYKTAVIKTDIEPGEGEDKYGYIFKMILQNMVQAKLLHWQCALHGQHKSLDNFFENFIELGDTLAESIMGKYGRPVLSDDNLNLKLRNFESPKEGDLSEFMAHLTDCYAVKCRSLLDPAKDSELINIMDEISGLVDQTKYLVSLR